MLYPKNKDKNLSPELFKNPTSEYRCTPFWAWNCELNEDELHKEIDFMKEMGMGGFHMHTRVGQSTEYLSEAYMSFVKSCTEKAKKEKMLSWLYDEDKWPSGFAGGLVTKKPENRQKYLLGTVYKDRVKGIPLARYDLVFDENGYLVSYKRLAENEEAKAKEWFASIETTEESPWYNFQTYADTLSKSAIDDFINVTHEKYKAAVGDEFGKTVPAIFTDEPQVIHKSSPDFADSDEDIEFPFTTDFVDTYKETYNEDFLDTLPEVIWNTVDGDLKARYRYHDHATDRFVEAFCDNVGKWCKENGIMLTGHMMNEPSLESQTCSLGEAMRAYRSFGLPGVDMLCDMREYTTVKQAASATHQYGYPGVLSELYGVTNWDFDFRGHKLQGDWQAALGVSVRVPHLYWVSMRGEAKRDYPASIGHQSAWYKEYSYIEDHFARVNAVMTRGKPEVKIGVIHPVESYWLNFGPTDVSGEKRKELDERFENFISWMIFNTLDFDYICESLLKDQFGGVKDGFNVGEMKYDVVVVPGCETLRSSTVKALEEFADNGGKVIFMGDVATLQDAEKSDAPKRLSEKCQKIGWSKVSLFEALEPYRTIEIRNDRGDHSDNLIYAMRNDGDTKKLFICHVKAPNRLCVDDDEDYEITIKGTYRPTLLDTYTGEIKDFPAKYKNGKTVISWNCYSQSSLLLSLEEGMTELNESEVVDLGEAEYAKDGFDYVLDEPNVCILDMAQWKIDDGQWFPKEETLRLCVKAKELLGLSTDAVHGAQPWVAGNPEAKNTITTKMTFTSEVEVDGAFLALEDFDESEILFNGEKVEKISQGYYVDFSITKVKIGKIRKGENTVEVTKPFSVISNVENMFILGDFGVDVIGTSVTIVAPKKELHFGDVTRQGLSFYGGAVTYKIPVTGGKETRLRLGLFAAPCVVAFLDGKKIDNISLAPYEADFGLIPEGEHMIELKVYLSRVNTFGTLHNSNRTVKWFGPDSWYSEDERWSYEYHLVPDGLITAPRIFKK